MNTFCSDVYWSENMLLDLLSLRLNKIEPSEAADYFRSRSEALSCHFTQIALQRRTDFAAIAGAGLHRLANYFASRAATAEAFEFFFTEAECAPRSRALDYLGLDYYDPFVSHSLRVMTLGLISRPTVVCESYSALTTCPKVALPMINMSTSL